MSKEPAHKANSEARAKKGSADAADVGPIRDLPIDSPSLDAATDVLGGGTRKPIADPRPTESISINYTKIATD
jgi:hypothetical protein